MVGIDSNITNDIDQKIQDWIFQSWIHTEKDAGYREALAQLLRTLWPAAREIKNGNRDVRYVTLPGLCSYALGHFTFLSSIVNAAWVMVYLASFLLDKIEDQETDQPIFSIYNQGTVVNLTTGLILHAQRILIELGDQAPRTSALDDIRRKFVQATLEVCAGQHSDLTLKEPTFTQSWDMVNAKSGKFFSLGAYLGARLATDDPDILETFSEFGRYLGIIIQISNDIYGIGKDEDIGSDLAHGKRTLPVQFALVVLPDEERLRLVQCLLSAPQDHQAEIEARKMITSAGAIVYLSLEARKHQQQAENILSKLDLDQKAMGPLIDLLDFASHNNKGHQDH